MTSEWSTIICRALILFPGLAGLYFLFVAEHLRSKAVGWTVFQFSLISLWLTTAWPRSGFSNPLLSTLVVSILAFSLGIFMIFTVLSVGIWRQYGTLKEKEIERKENA